MSHAPELPGVLACLVVTVVVEVGLRVTTLPRLTRLLGVPLELTGVEAADPDRLRPPMLPPKALRQVRATRRALRHWPFGDTCLRQALVSGQRLRRLNPTLHLGVSKIEGDVRAHAWLVVQGAVIDPRRAVAPYRSLAAVPPEVTRL